MKVGANCKKKPLRLYRNKKKQFLAKRSSRRKHPFDCLLVIMYMLFFVGLGSVEAQEAWVQVYYHHHILLVTARREISLVGIVVVCFWQSKRSHDWSVHGKSHLIVWTWATIHKRNDVKNSVLSIVSHNIPSGESEGVGKWRSPFLSSDDVAFGCSCVKAERVNPICSDSDE
jgi:hypothetical protein